MFKKKRKTTQAAKHSLHQSRKRRHIGPKCRPPHQRKKLGDLEGGWQFVRIMHRVSMQLRAVLWALCESRPSSFR